MTIAPGIALLEAKIAEICRRHHVRELSLFGSAVRGETGPESDIDLLVDYLPEARPSLFDLIGMRNELSDLLGRKVDLGVKRALKSRYRDRVFAEMRVIYCGAGWQPAACFQQA
jgi:predicted nucleotidyltransferase